jgi:hypothetical protein
VEVILGFNHPREVLKSLNELFPRLSCEGIYPNVSRELVLDNQGVSELIVGSFQLEDIKPNAPEWPWKILLECRREICRLAFAWRQTWQLTVNGPLILMPMALDMSLPNASLPK